MHALKTGLIADKFATSLDVYEKVLLLFRFANDP